MIEVSEVPKSDREDCWEIIYKICELLSVDIKNKNCSYNYKWRHYCQVQRQNIT